MGEPTDEERGILKGDLLDSPEFLGWAKKQGKDIRRTTPAHEVTALAAQYRREKERAEENALRLRARAARDRADERAVLRDQAQQREQLKSAIAKGWGTTDSFNDAKYAAQKEIPLQKRLQGQHWESDRKRWAYIRHYLRALRESWRLPLDDAVILEEAVQSEELYLAEISKQKRADQDAARSLKIRERAARAPMNPVVNFEPGIADYNVPAAARQPKWVDNFAGHHVAGQAVELTYSDGGSLTIPLSAEVIFGSALGMGEAVRTFTRRHRKSGREVPFVVYDQGAGDPYLSAVSEQDLALMGVPRFDPLLTPRILSLFAEDADLMLVAAKALLALYAMWGGARGVKPVARFTAAAMTTGYTAARSVVTATRAVSIQVLFAVRTYGVSRTAVSYLGGKAYTYYLTNAVAVNQALIVGSEITAGFGGVELGPISPGDSVRFAITEGKALVRGGAKVWKQVEAEVEEVVGAASEFRLRVMKADVIDERVARETYDEGKSLLVAQPPRKPPTQQVTRAVDDPATTNTGVTGARATDDPHATAGVRKPIVPEVPRGQAKVKLVPIAPIPVTRTDRIRREALRKVKEGLTQLAQVTVALGQRVKGKFESLSGAEAVRRLYRNRLSEFPRLAQHWPKQDARAYVAEIQRLIMDRVKNNRKLAQEFAIAFQPNRADPEAVGRLTAELLNRLPVAVRREIKKTVMARWNKIRETFWRNVHDDPGLVAELQKLGITFPGRGRAPVLRVGGKDLQITLDHISRKVENPLEAFNPANLRPMTPRENSSLKESLVKDIKEMTGLSLDEFNRLSPSQGLPKELADELGKVLDEMSLEDDLFRGDFLF